MIYINKNSANTTVLTLTEKVSINNPYFLFTLTSKEGNEEVSFISQDISSATTRYNKFILTESGSTSVNLTQGIFHLENTGWFTYKVREQASSSNITPSLSGNIVEEGMAFVQNVSSINFTTDNSRINFKNG